MLTQGDIAVTLGSKVRNEENSGPMRALPDTSFPAVIERVRMQILGGMHEKMVRMHLAVTYGPENGFLLYQAARLHLKWFR